MSRAKRCLTTAMAITAVVVCLLVCAPRAEEKPSGAGERQAALSIADFEKMHQELQPPKDELWRSIPWQVSIIEGRELAAKLRKPIFVWVASGEPLGCG